MCVEEHISAQQHIECVSEHSTPPLAERCVNEHTLEASIIMWPPVNFNKVTTLDSPYRLEMSCLAQIGVLHAPIFVNSPSMCK